MPASRSSRWSTATPIASPSNCAAGSRRVGTDGRRVPRGDAPGACGCPRRAAAGHDRQPFRRAQGGGADGRARLRARGQCAATVGRRGDREPLVGDGQPQRRGGRDDRLDLQRARPARWPGRGRRRRHGLRPGRDRTRARARARGRGSRAPVGSHRAPPFDFLQRVPPERTAALLRSESPQTVG